MSERAERPCLTSGREREVWRALDSVTDPELDEPVTDMGFVTDVKVLNGGEVSVSFRLPTFWCAPNFAFMMGEDMRRAILALDWVRDAKVILREHLCVDAINRGVNEGLSFRAAFGGEASGDLDDLRRTFLRKAFEWRQEALLTHLLTAGATAHDVVRLTIRDLNEMDAGEERRTLVRRYLDRRHVADGFAPSNQAFVSLDGRPLEADTLTDYLRSIRRVRANAEFNGALCRGLLAVRAGDSGKFVLESASVPPVRAAREPGSGEAASWEK